MAEGVGYCQEDQVRGRPTGEVSDNIQTPYSVVCPIQGQSVMEVDVGVNASQPL